MDKDQEYVQDNSISEASKFFNFVLEKNRQRMKQIYNSETGEVDPEIIKSKDVRIGTKSEPVVTSSSNEPESYGGGRKRDIIDAVRRVACREYKDLDMTVDLDKNLKLWYGIDPTLREFIYATVIQYKDIVKKVLTDDDVAKILELHKYIHEYDDYFVSYSEEFSDLCESKGVLVKNGFNKDGEIIIKTERMVYNDTRVKNFNDFISRSYDVIKGRIGPEDSDPAKFFRNYRKWVSIDEHDRYVKISANLIIDCKGIIEEFAYSYDEEIKENDLAKTAYDTKNDEDDVAAFVDAIDAVVSVSKKGLLSYIESVSDAVSIYESPKYVKLPTENAALKGMQATIDEKERIIADKSSSHSKIVDAYAAINIISNKIQDAVSNQSRGKDTRKIVIDWVLKRLIDGDITEDQLPLMYHIDSMCRDLMKNPDVMVMRLSEDEKRVLHENKELLPKQFGAISKMLGYKEEAEAHAVNQTKNAMYMSERFSMYQEYIKNKLDQNPDFQFSGEDAYTMFKSMLENMPVECVKHVSIKKAKNLASKQITDPKEFIGSMTSKMLLKPQFVARLEKIYPMKDEADMPRSKEDEIVRIQMLKEFLRKRIAEEFANKSEEEVNMIIGRYNQILGAENRGFDDASEYVIDSVLDPVKRETLPHEKDAPGEDVKLSDDASPYVMARGEFARARYDVSKKTLMISEVFDEGDTDLIEAVKRNNVFDPKLKEAQNKYPLRYALDSADFEKNRIGKSGSGSLDVGLSIALYTRIKWISSLVDMKSERPYGYYVKAGKDPDMYAKDLLRFFWNIYSKFMSDIGESVVAKYQHNDAIKSPSSEEVSEGSTGFVINAEQLADMYDQLMHDTSDESKSTSEVNNALDILHSVKNNRNWISAKQYDYVKSMMKKHLGKDIDYETAMTDKTSQYGPPRPSEEYAGPKDIAPDLPPVGHYSYDIVDKMTNGGSNAKYTDNIVASTINNFWRKLDSNISQRKFMEKIFSTIESRPKTVYDGRDCYPITRREKALLRDYRDGRLNPESYAYTN